jgi:hypothetical protein
VAEGLRLARDFAGVALLADRVDDVVAGARDAEGARKHPVALALADPVGLAGQQGLVHRQPAGFGDLAVGDELVAGADRDQVAGHDLVGDQLHLGPVADDPRVGGDEDGDFVQRLLRLLLLVDTDAGVDDGDQAEDRVGVEPEPDVEDEEAGDDRVEEGEDVGGDDARQRARGVLGGRP